MRVFQGSHQSACFKFPDFPRSFSLTFPDLMRRIWQVSHENLSEARKIFCTYKHIAFKNTSRNIWQNLVHLSQIKIPWLSLTLDKKYWNSLTFQKKIFFPDFPWWWEPWFFSQDPSQHAYFWASQQLPWGYFSIYIHNMNQYLSNLLAFACLGSNLTITSCSSSGAMWSIMGITVKKSGQWVTSRVTSSGMLPALRNGIIRCCERPTSALNGISYKEQKALLFLQTFLLKK